MRTLYRLVLCLHPAAFRCSFSDEMLSIFDEASGNMEESASTLLLDALTSLARQWLLRTNCWKILVALAVAAFQIGSFGLGTRGYQHWAHNNQSITPYMQEVILITLTCICTLFVMVMALTLWMMSFLTRRPAHPGARGADARRQTERNIREALGGEADTASALRVFLGRQ